MEPLLVPIFTQYPDKIDAVALLGLSRSTVKKLVASGELESLTEGRKRLVVVASIRAYVERRRIAAREHGGEAA